MLNRIRLPFYLSKPQYPADEEIYLKGNGRRVTLKSIVSKVMEGKTEYMPSLLHERLNIALRHDEVNIESDKYTGSVRLTGAYEINWIDFLDFPFAPASFQAFEEAFVARSNKCEICDDSSSISLEDDNAGTVDEGDSFDVNVAANDSICCSDPVFSIFSYDTDYIDTISISQVGLVSITLKTPLASAADKLLFTYKVVCGSAEEFAEVIGTVDGSLTPLCEAPSNLVLALIDPDSAEISASWDEPSGGAPADGYEWQLLDDADVVISSGTTSSLSVNINSLDCDATYEFKVRAVCAAEDFSAYITDEITIPNCDGVIIEDARYSTDLVTHCSELPNTVYTDDGTITTGKTIYTDISLSTVLSGFDFISAISSGIIYNLNSLTGLVGSNTGDAC